MNPSLQRLLKIAFFLLCSVGLFAVVFVSKPPDTTEDIYFVWQDGHLISQGVNPYSKIIGSDMLNNDKYTTYFPGFFLVIAAASKLGVDTYEGWIRLWRPICAIVDLIIGFVFFSALSKRCNFWLALFGAAFWIFNRWTLYVVFSGQIDLLAILFILMSFLALGLNSWRSAILFGLSLSIKQLAVFLLPLYLLLSTECSKPLRECIRCWIGTTVKIMLVPAIIILPFLFWDAEGFVRSIFFSATRAPGGHFGAQSIDDALGLVGLIAKGPMLGMMGLIYLLAYCRLIPRYTAAFLVFMSFVCFNSMFFKQYLAWGFAFFPLMLLEFAPAREEQSKIYNAAIS